jgi:hypothetical protein
MNPIYDYLASQTDISIKFNQLTKNTTINEFMSFIRRNKYFKSQFESFGIKFEGRSEKESFRVCFPADLVTRITIFKVRMIPETVPATLNTPRPSSYYKGEYSEGHIDYLFRSSGFNDIIEDVYTRLVLETNNNNLRVSLCEKFVKKLGRRLGVNKNINSIFVIVAQYVIQSMRSWENY